MTDPEKQAPGQRTLDQRAPALDPRSPALDQRAPVLDVRRAGVLLPLFSLDRGQGALGREARDFVDWLAAARFTVWQLLPVGPAGADGSPYWLRSDHAWDARHLDWRDLPSDAERAADPGSALHAEFLAYRRAHRHWLDDYALFEALSRHFAGSPWVEWPVSLRDRERAALVDARRKQQLEIERVEVEQFLCDRAWHALRRYAHSRNVRLFGDLPIYVAPDSAETWQHRETFDLAPDGRARAVAGVPPDYFSEEGQRWGNPLYDWRNERAHEFRFWRARVTSALARFDLLRIDHFRGLESFWAVPANAPSARTGEWRHAPGDDLLAALLGDASDMPFVAEDLGLITPEVDALRKRFELPGMRVLQFAFDGDPRNTHLPREHTRDSVVYSGTHDNDTTAGWLEKLDDAGRQRVRDALALGDDANLLDAIVRAVFDSPGVLAILPASDLLGSGSEARINTPGTVRGNWSWRLPRDALHAELSSHFARENGRSGRALLP